MQAVVPLRIFCGVLRVKKFKFHALAAAVLVLRMASAVFAADATVTGTISAPQTSAAQRNGTLTFVISQAAIVTGGASLTTSPVYCYTSTDGTVRGLPNPQAAALATGNTSAGSISAGTYYVGVSYYVASTETLVSVPVTAVVLASTGRILVTAPVVQPAGATGYKVYVGTSPTALKLQATTSGWGGTTVSTYNSEGTAQPASNNTVCTVTANDSTIPQTTYRVSLAAQNGSTVPGFPQQTYLVTGTNDVSNGWPVAGVQPRFPNPILANPASQAQQSINSPLTTNGYNLTAGAVILPDNDSPPVTQAGTAYLYNTNGTLNIIADALNFQPSFTNGVTFCNSSTAGSTADVKLANCYTALAATGGTIDAQALQGAQTWAGCPFTGWTKQTTVLLSAATFSLATDCTVPTNVTLVLYQGAIVSVANTKTLTVQGGFIASLSQHIAGAGSTAFSTGSRIVSVVPQWWGATADGSTDDTTAIQSAFTAVKASNGRELFFPLGAYKYTSTLAITGNGTTLRCETPGLRWRSTVLPTKLLFYGANSPAVSMVTTAAQNLSGASIIGCAFDGTNATGTSDGLLMQANAGGGDSIEGVLIADSSFANFPRYQTYALRTVYDVTWRRVAFLNPAQAADNLVQYVYDGTAGAASQWTFDDCWFAIYTTGKWAFFAGKAAIPYNNNVIADVRFVNGTVASYDTGGTTSSYGANGVWVNGGLSINGTHFENLPYDQQRTIGIRYTGSNGANIQPLSVSFYGTGIELGNSGNEIGGTARLSDESINVLIPESVSLNNAHCNLAAGAVINCSDVRVVETGNRRGTLLRANSNETTNNTYFGSLDGQPIVLMEPSRGLSTCTNATPIACTTSSNHGWSTGQTVKIAEQAGNTAANGIWRITVTGVTTFTLDGSAGSGPPTANTGVVSVVSNDVDFCNFTAASGGLRQCNPLQYDSANRRLGINKTPALTLDVSTPANNGIRLSNSSNSGQIVFQALADGTNYGNAIVYDNAGAAKTFFTGNTSSVSYNKSPLQTSTINYIAAESAGSANNALVVDLANVTLAAGVCIHVELTHTLVAGGNTINFNSSGALALKSHFSSANNIATAYAATGQLHTCYDGALWLDMSQ